VRELENVIERAFIVSRGPILQLAEQLETSAQPITDSLAIVHFGEFVKNVERDHIRKILEAVRWKIEGPNGAAQALGLKPSTLRFRMQKLNIQKPRNS
jgi:transcriptional regulator with GAF, ATPase, and Fis domain